MSDKRLEDAAQHIVEAARKHGIAMMPVEQGYLVMVTKERLLEILQRVEQEGAQEAILLVRDVRSLN